MLKLGLALSTYITINSMLISDSFPKPQPSEANSNCKLCLATKCIDETLACIKTKGCRKLVSYMKSCGAPGNTQCLDECRNKMSHKQYEKAITPATKLITCTMTDTECRDVCAK